MLSGTHALEMVLVRRSSKVAMGDKPITGGESITALASPPVQIGTDLLNHFVRCEGLAYPCHHKRLSA